MDRYISRICSGVGLINPIGHWHSAGQTSCFGRYNAPSANLHTSPCRRTRPFPFSPLAHLPTRGPSGQTRWKKTSFALARLRPSSEYADGLLTESRLTNPTTIGSNPMKKVSFALARLRPSSEYADGLLSESRLANPTSIGSNPMEENQSKIPKSPMYIYYI